MGDVTRPVLCCRFSDQVIVLRSSSITNAVGVRDDSGDLIGLQRISIR